MQNPPQSPRRGGLARLSPTLRLALVFAFSFFYVFVNNLAIAAAIMLIGILIFWASARQNWKVGLAAIFPGIMLLLYNTILSPRDAGGVHWFIFTVNAAGFARGLVTGMRLIGVMLVSFAWLVITPIPEMYAGLAWAKPIRPWVLELLRGVQIVKREFIALTQSLIMRGLKWDSPLANIRNLVPLAMAIIPRVADNAQKTTFAMQSHRGNDEGDAPPAAAERPAADGIHVSQVSARYSPRLPDVLHDVDLSVKPGEFVYLAGPDMAGKTTLLRLMGGVIPRIMGEFRGDARVDGRATHEVALSDLSARARYVAPEPFSSIYGLTVGQEIMFLARDEGAGRAALATMNIAHLWNRETTKLSGGQQVRLVLAGALASQARYLLLDSPMQELDPDGRRDFMQALATLRATRDVAVVVADPFWRDLAPFAERVAVLEQGRVIAAPAASSFFDDATAAGGDGWLARCKLVKHLARPTLATPGGPVAGLSGVHVTLENTPILHGINLAVHEGELLAIMGPNGSGKTTAMLTLAGAIRPVQGTVTAPKGRAYIFQDAKIQMVADTVRGELALGPNILHWPADRGAAFVAAGLAWTGLDPDICPLDLHPAQARMLAIAACNTDSRVVILDEPTVGLDSAGIEKVMALVTTMLAQGKAVIIVTHDAEVASLAHRILVIRDGQVAEERVAGGA
jgi:energy-coupling factor transport system ATP-binding protein